MSAPGQATCHRLTAALVLTALALIVVPAPGLPALADADALESCRSCEGCEDGRCAESSPFDSADHCCPSSCLTHLPWAFSAPDPAAPWRYSETALVPDSQRPLQAVPRAVYQPPRS